MVFARYDLFQLITTSRIFYLDLLQYYRSVNNRNGSVVALVTKNIVAKLIKVYLGMREGVFMNSWLETAELAQA